MLRTQDLTHIRVVVRDLERSLRFYKAVFGMEERFRDGPKMVFLNTPGSRDLITFNEDPAEARLAGVHRGVAHFGFRLANAADLDAAIAGVEGAGGRLIRRVEHGPGVAFAYIEDPDGYVIELLFLYRYQRRIERALGGEARLHDPSNQPMARPV